MARQVLPIVGLVVGAYFGNPQLGYAIGSIIGNAVDPEVIKGPKIGDAGVQTSAEGVPRPIVFGTAPVVGNLIYRGNRQIRTQSDGGKGGPVTETQREFWTFGIRIGEPIAGVTRIWEDEKLVYDIRPGTTIAAESAKYANSFRLYLGTEDQLPDPSLEAYLGAGNVCAHHGTAYIVFANYDLTDRRGSVPNYRFEVAAVVDSSFEPSLLAGTVVFTGTGDHLEESRELVDMTPSSRTASISRDGVYVSGGKVGGVAPFMILGKLSEDGETYDPIALPAAPPTGDTYSTSFHPAADLLAVSFNIPGNTEGWQNSRLHIYKYANDVFTLVDQDDGTGGLSATWSKAGDQLAWTQGLDSITHGMKIYGINQGTGALTSARYAAANLSSQPPERLNWHPAGTYLAEENNGGLVVWDAMATPLVEVARESSGTYPNSGRGALWSPDGSAIFTFAGIAVGGHTVARYPFNAGVLGLVTFPAQPPSAPFDTAITSNNSLIAVAMSGVPNQSVYIYEIEAGDSDIYPVADQPFTTASAANSVAWTPFLGAGEQQGQSQLLGDIVTALHARVKQYADKFDVSELVDQCDGVVFAGDYTVADGIRSMLTPYFSDTSEYDGGSGWRIHYIKRGKAVVKTLTVDDLVDMPDESVRESAIEFPQKLHLFFQNPLIGYAPAKATSTRSSPDVRVVGEASVQVPVTIDDVDEAARISNKLHKIAWAEAGGEVTLTVTDEQLDLVAADCIGLALRGTVRRLRIVKIDDDPGTRKLTCRVDRQSAYRSRVTGIPLPPPTPPPPSIVGETVFAFGDWPALTDNDDSLSYYVAAEGTTEAWHGAAVQRKDNVGEFETVQLFSSGSIIGALQNAVPDASEHYTDTTNQLQVQLFSAHEIDSLTQQQFLSEAGGIAVENVDGTWELMQYRDVDQIDELQVVLSTLHRGRLNTPTSSHAIGGRVVFLDTVRLVSAVTAMIDTDLTHRAVSFGTSPELAPLDTHEYTAQTQREWPVADLVIVPLLTPAIEATAIPRHRFGTDDNPVRSINWIGYRWTVTDGTHTITRDGTADTERFDITAWTTPITVTVAQVNRFTGAGPTYSEVFE